MKEVLKKNSMEVETLLGDREQNICNQNMAQAKEGINKFASSETKVSDVDRGIHVCMFSYS